MTLTTATPVVPNPEFPELTVADRCDSCGAQAFLRWYKGDSDLLTCSHHGNKYEAGLIVQGFNVYQDARETLNSKPSPSANV